MFPRLSGHFAIVENQKYASAQIQFCDWERRTNIQKQSLVERSTSRLPTVQHMQEKNSKIESSSCRCTTTLTGETKTMTKLSTKFLKCCCIRRKVSHTSCCWFNVLLKKKVVHLSTQTTTFSLLGTRSKASVARKCCSYRQPVGSQTTSSLLAPHHSVARNGFFPARKPVSIQARTSPLQVLKVSIHIIASTNFLQQCIVEWQANTCPKACATKQRSIIPSFVVTQCWLAKFHAMLA